MKLRTLVLIGCLILSVFLTSACWLDEDGTRLDGTDGDEVIDAIPNAPVDPRFDKPETQ